MRFGDLQAFYFLIGVPVFALFYWWAFWRKRKALHAFGAPALMDKLASGVSRVRQGIKAALMCVGALIQGGLRGFCTGRNRI